MHAEDYIDLFNTEENLWWFVGMRKISSVLLEEFRQSKFESALDIGCGTGLNLRWLRQYTHEAEVQGLDVELTPLEFCRQRGEQLLVQSSATDLPFTDESFDLITNFDVLVQLVGKNADEKAIAEMFRVLKPNGLAFVRVAAYEWMKSGHDESLHTQRRYSLAEISQKLERGGFTVLRKTYANSLLFPVAFFKRKVLQSLGLSSRTSDVKPFPPSLQWLNWIFTRLLLFEARFLQYEKARLPFGLSAICVVRKS